MRFDTKGATNTGYHHKNSISYRCRQKDRNMKIDGFMEDSTGIHGSSLTASVERRQGREQHCTRHLLWCESISPCIASARLFLCIPLIFRGQVGHNTLRAIMNIPMEGVGWEEIAEGILLYRITFIHIPLRYVSSGVYSNC